MATAPSFTESTELLLNDLLMRICAEVQLDDGRHQHAERSYLAVAKLLEEHPLVRGLDPTMYPQGSMQLGTTAKPLAGEEFDLDFVSQFSCDAQYFASPVQALDVVEKALKSSDAYKNMVERKNRCIRLNYQHRFHLDILPACRDSEKGGTCIWVPDRRLVQWTPSNPKGFASWFDGRARQSTARRFFDKAEPLPPKLEAPQKSPLKLAIQLLKRRRDIRHKSSPGLAPVSIVLTALAGEQYNGDQSISSALGSILSGISDRIRSEHPRVVVLNPTNRDEDLSERWDLKPAAYQSFVDGVKEFDSHWKLLLQTRGIDKIAQQLERMFGEDVAKRTIENQAREIEAARRRNALSVKKGSGVLTVAAGSAVVPVRPNTFHGTKT